jgi:glycosyltransferase involved in cell wall biosynthesis
MTAQHHLVEERTKLLDMEHFPMLLPYPVDMSAFLTFLNGTFDAVGAPGSESPAGFHPTKAMQYALAHWNQYLATKNEHHRRVFLAQAYWLVEHQVSIGEDAAGWPISSSHPDLYTSGPWVSALTQGSGISVLLRAYQLTLDETFLEVVYRVVRTFERDILDGGIGAPIGEDGIFFEEVAVYPAAHILGGFIFALFGLYDYVAMIQDPHIETLISRSLATLHSMLNEFDAGFWTHPDLLHRRLASPSELTLQIILLEALASYSGCDHCSRLARHWQGYLHHPGSRFRYLVASKWFSCRQALLGKVRRVFFPAQLSSDPTPVCVAIPSFPIMGGILTVLEGVERVMNKRWRIEYLTQRVGPQQERFNVHRFGTLKTSPWNFPLVWLYVITGISKLLLLLHRGAGYRTILPQDGIYTGAFAALAAKLADVRVVCIDHGDLSLFTTRNNRIYRSECIEMVMKKKWPWLVRFFARLCLEFYWPSRSLLARISARFVDHLLIPGVATDGVEEICKNIGVPPSRITRYPSMIDVENHVVPDAPTRATTRQAKGISVDAIVISIICRLAPEKGLDIAIESISRAIATLAPELRARVRVAIAGDGPLRQQIEESICTYKLQQTCLLWGEISATEVVSLLGISDIFLYTSTRGACFAMAVLEAMASRCAVIASTEPIANAILLAEGRGVAVPPYDVEQTTKALVQLMNDQELCGRMGSLARDYIALHHSPTVFRRTLLRATQWSELDVLLKHEPKLQAVPNEKM